MKLYKGFSLSAAVIFSVVGFIFLFFPDSALTFFNGISGYFGMKQSPVQGFNFYLTLASAYMYLVTLLAFLMFRHPEQRIFPFLLAHGKMASSILSIYLFLTFQPYLIFLANFIVDGSIGTVAVIFFLKMKKAEA